MKCHWDILPEGKHLGIFNDAQSRGMASGKWHPLQLRALRLLLSILVLFGPFATSAFDFRYFSFFFGYFGFF